MMECSHHGFRAMGADVSIYGPKGPPDAFAHACNTVESCFKREEQRFSRFRAESELSAVNAAAGHWIPVSMPFASLVRLALEQADRTDGLFDPCVLGAVIASGYDRDFDEILAGARGALHPPVPCGRWREVEVRFDAIRLPAGTGLDVGGIAKGWTVDLAAKAAVSTGLPWILVSAGGDLRIAGDAPAIDVSIEDPVMPSDAAGSLRLASGALATSSTMRRAWGPDLHHVIDPRTGAPAQTPIVQATVWAPTCAEAEVLATWALLTGSEALDAVPCALVTDDGELLVNFRAGVAA
jgi:thiamine biosynthesis lipoprotein